MPTFLIVLLIASGGALGALCRYLMVVGVQNLWGISFPYGTLLVNCLGSFLAGFFLSLMVGRYSAAEHFRLFLFTGFLGALTTFSSFAAENLTLFEHEQWLKLCANILLNNAGALLMVYMGWHLAKLILLNEWMSYVR